MVISLNENVDYEKLFTEYRVIIETYAFLDKHINNILINKYVPFLQKGAKNLILSYKVKSELVYKTENKSDKYYKEANEAIVLINNLYNKNKCIELIGNYLDYDLESQLRYVISKKSEKGKIAVITKNARLAKGLLEFVKKRAIYGVKILNISNDSELVDWNIREKPYDGKEIVSVRCKKCRKFYKIPREKADEIINSGKELYCSQCDELFIKYKCEDCGNDVTISKEKYDYITSKGNGIYCRDCINQRIKYTQCSSCRNKIVVKKDKYDSLTSKNIDVLCNKCIKKKYNKEI